MGLSKEVQQELSQALTGDLAEVVSTLSITSNDTSNYDPVTDTYATPTTYNAKGIITGYSAYLINGKSILETDQQLVGLATDFDQVPKEGDEVNGYKMIKIDKDPLGITYKIQLRKI